ncbi:MAG: hypothetical protein GF418_15470 [Chitinivibrionales bacterium]|nr:hypothetical protein [Chitinivibrionales bacterium]MBD3397021.1 hypothetical protein [Chitinivibrionales bacterium]
MIRKLLILLVFTGCAAGVYLSVAFLFDRTSEGRLRVETLYDRPDRGGERGQNLVGGSDYDTLGRPFTEMYHPLTGAVTGIVTDATFEECGILTGDYDEDNPERPEYIDQENGWSRGKASAVPDLRTDPEVVVTGAARHFGRKGIEVTNAFGPSRNFRLQQGRDYVLSLWMKVASGRVPLERGVVLDLDYRQLSPSSPDWPIWLDQKTLKCSGELRVEKHRRGWHYLELLVPASRDISAAEWAHGFRYARMYAGVPQGDGKGGDATVYIDDIRFRPVDSKSCSFFLDGKGRERETCVGPDNREIDCDKVERVLFEPDVDSSAVDSSVQNN